MYSWLSIYRKHFDNISTRNNICILCILSRYITLHFIFHSILIKHKLVSTYSCMLLLLLQSSDIMQVCTQYLLSNWKLYSKKAFCSFFRMLFHRTSRCRLSWVHLEYWLEFLSKCVESKWSGHWKRIRQNNTPGFHYLGTVPYKVLSRCSLTSLHASTITITLIQ